MLKIKSTNFSNIFLKRSLRLNQNSFSLKFFSQKVNICDNPYTLEVKRNFFNFFNLI